MTPPTVQFIPGGGSDYTDYIVSGVGYWIIPDGTGTGAVSGPTGGDSSTTWSQIVMGYAGGTTFDLVDYGSVTAKIGPYGNVMTGGYQQFSNPYNYCACWFDGNGGYAKPQAPGWIIFAAEANPPDANANRHIYCPVEVQSGVVGGTITAAGYSPVWNAAGFDDSLIFFFNSYTPGDVQGWTAWDGVTTP